MSTSLEHVVETDILVIGGGIAGCFAAIKAKEKGVTVVLVNKGYVGKSGQTPPRRSTPHEVTTWKNG